MDLRECSYFLLSQEVVDSIYALADGSLGDWFGGFLFSAGQQANEAVQDQLSSLSFARYTMNSFMLSFVSLSPPPLPLKLDTCVYCLLFAYLFTYTVWQ